MGSVSTVDFRPPWYLRSGHFQTVLTSIYRPKQTLQRTIRHIVPLPGSSGATSIYENRPPSNSPSTKRRDSKRAILLLHGLGSSHGGAYMCNVAAKLVAQGERVIRVDLPGSGPSSHLTWLPAHAGCSEEVWGILAWCKSNLGITDWRAIGFSLGGNILLRMLGVHADELATPGAEWKVSAALAMAPPIDLATCCDGMEGPINRWYARHFLKILLNEVKLRAQVWPEWASIAALPSPTSIREFDDRYTAPLAGFASADEYYRESSSGPLLKKIVTPTILLCDYHDPIVPAKIFDEALSNQFIGMHWTRRGGHLGYLHRSVDGRFVRWADQWVAEQIMGLNPS